MLIRRVLLATISFAAMMCAGGQSSAGSFTVSPTRIELTDDTSTGVVTLRNTASTETIVQVETFAWNDSPSIADLEPTRDVLAVPTVFRLAPEDRQVVRIKSRMPPGDEERSYRLVLSEVASNAGSSSTGVQFALRLSLPLFIKPAGAEARPEWSLRDGSADGKGIHLSNPGSAHVHVRSLTVTDQDGRRVVTDPVAPFYVLAGKSQDIRLPEPGAGPPVRIAADTNIGPVSLDLVD